MISRSGPLSIDRFRTMLDRMVKSARLNRDTFLELKEDSTATVQALTVLALAGASFGFGFAAAIGYNTIGILLGAVFGAVVSIALGIVWVSLTFLIGRSLFGGRSNYWSLARPVFSTSPGLIFLIMSIPVSPIPDVARAIGVAWIAISTVIAVKSAMGIHNSRNHRSPRLWICGLSVERHLEIVNRNTRGGLLLGSWSLCHRGFVFVENIHCRVFLHVVIPVQMFL